MDTAEKICALIAILAPLLISLTSFIYGIFHFFKKGKPLYMQSVTMAMGCYSLGCIYNLCQILTLGRVLSGFTPAYLGRIGFFLFLILASYGQLDKIVDDGSKLFRKSRIVALIAPIVAIALLVFNLLNKPTLSVTKVAYCLVWLSAIFSLYFNLKHAIIPDMNYGFVKAIKPFNWCALLLGFSELLILTALNYFNIVFLLVTSLIFSVLCFLSVLFVVWGVKRWTI